MATNGVEALDFLSQRGDNVDAPRPDIILLDLDLPLKNGDKVLGEIRDDDDVSLSQIPVIANQQFIWASHFPSEIFKLGDGFLDS